MPDKKTSTRELKRQIGNLTNGLLGTATDLVLFSLFIGISSVGKSRTSRGTHQAANEAEQILQAINYQTLKNTFSNLKRQGLIKSARRALLSSTITDAGLARIKSKIPVYDTRRSWDRMLYLVSYDIERQYNLYRDRLRNTLEAFGAARIQASLYLTPYNPNGMLETFVAEHGKYGEVLVSMLTEDSQIGDEKNLKQLLWNYFELEVVNEAYNDFIKKYKGKPRYQTSRYTVAFDFFSVVAIDPQLPFELLFSRYKGDAACLLYKHFTSLQ